ncbi:hypothetical protein Aperf_G00000046674 [Anoplocephala perfoliata]
MKALLLGGAECRTLREQQSSLAHRRTVDDIDIVVYHFSIGEDAMLSSSSVNANGIPPDLEFTLEEISRELAKLGVEETSPTRLAAIKADLDTMIARDLDSLSIGGRGDSKSGISGLSNALTTSASFSSGDSNSTLTSAKHTTTEDNIIQGVNGGMRKEEMSTPEGYFEEISATNSSTDSDSNAEHLQRQSHSANSVFRKRWVSQKEDDGPNRRSNSSRGSRCSNSGRSTPSIRCPFGGQYYDSSTSASQCGDMPSTRGKNLSNRPSLQSNPLENTDFGRNSPGSGTIPRRRGVGVKRGDPVSLWRLYKSQWERRARANAATERALRWSVKAAMAVREVPMLNSSRRSLLYGPFPRI